MKPAHLLLAVLALLCVPGVLAFQDRLLYFPERCSVGDLLTGGLQAWPDARDFRGLLAEPAGPARGTAIVFHGNAGHAGHRRFYAEALTRLGLRVVLAEYPGYGPRAGDLGETSLVADAAAGIALAHARYGGPLLVVGESLGAGVAAQAAARERDKVAALWLITPWDRLASVAAHHYPWLPVTWLLRDRYDSAAALADFRRPVLVTLAERDRIIPIRFGDALYAALPEPKRRQLVQGGEHNDWIERVDAAWWREAGAFLLPAAARQEPILVGS